MNFFTTIIKALPALAVGVWSLGLASVAQADPPDPTASIMYAPPSGGSTGLPFIGLPPAEVCAGFEFYGITGDKQTGTMDCSADLTNLTRCNVRSGVTIADVLGAYPSIDCPLANATTMTDLNFGNFDARMKSSTEFEWFDSTGMRHHAAGDADLFLAENLAFDVTVFNQTGKASNFPIEDPWDLRAGTVVGAVTGKLKVNCRNAVNLAITDLVFPGLSATLDHTTERITIPNHGLAAGAPVRLLYSGQPGGILSSNDFVVRLVNVNTIELAWPSTPGTLFTFSSNGAGVTVHRRNDGIRDTWDTIDDPLALSSPANFPSAWSFPDPANPTKSKSNHWCGNEDPANPSDDDVWKDVTIAGTGDARCLSLPGRPGSPENCTMQDKITGLKWSKLASTSANWYGAITTCHSLAHNGQLAGTWRLPTQKELLDAYGHGILSAARPNWMTFDQLGAMFWSATSHANPNVPNNAHWVSLASGYNYNYSKTSMTYVVCVQ